MKRILLIMLVLGLLVAAGCGVTGGAVKTAEVNINFECTDAENGINEFAQGAVYGVDDIGSFEKKDKCIGSYFLFEYYCDGNVMTHQNFRCFSGCEEGACQS